ncbi:hypothetical protein Celaphus_00013986 [Cervus elaphus hippelaphus]|uniref:Uncharacterized protein n=1 Tax=Cervus elaphus hippelaphus TaxID=46360 RepID=A0A212CCZ9_CEREH|nr:hypothetical protein Celaphus_00013986 [Cervus elaphus hippelaphus]
MPSKYISCYTCQALLLHRDYLCAYSSKCGVTFHLCGRMDRIWKKMFLFFG